jgi:capsular polysaccharide biosynthesis protein
MSVGQQIEKFADAEIVIAPHGAGIANIIFAPENATLIELLPKSYQHLAGWMVAKLGRKKYGRIICEEITSTHNLLVDIPKLDKMLQKAIA